MTIMSLVRHTGESRQQVGSGVFGWWILCRFAPVRDPQKLENERSLIIAISAAEFRIRGHFFFNRGGDPMSELKPVDGTPFFALALAVWSFT